MRFILWTSPSRMRWYLSNLLNGCYNATATVLAQAHNLLFSNKKFDRARCKIRAYLIRMYQPFASVKMLCTKKGCCSDSRLLIGHTAGWETTRFSTKRLLKGLNVHFCSCFPDRHRSLQNPRANVVCSEAICATNVRPWYVQIIAIIDHHCLTLWN